jgi:hypothetical protein
MAIAMLRLFRMIPPVLVGLLLCAATQPQVPAAPALTERDRHDLRCAAAFAVTAVAQSRADKAALALPPLGIRGKRYLGLVGERLAATGGLSGEAVRDLLTQAARAVAHEGASGVAASCLGDLDGIVPPRPAPDAVTCLALLDVYAQVLASRDPADQLAVRLSRESASVAPAAHALLSAKGLDSAGEAVATERERTRIREALTGGPATIDADDFAQCRHLAAGLTR